jgi:hypothetical protein
VLAALGLRGARVKISVKDGGIHIDDVPDAIKLIKLNGHKARRAADLALHRSDLEFAKECLTQINKFLSPSDATVRQALWKTAICQYIKCFGSSASRGQLNAKKILKGDSLGLEIHQYFKDLRNKHIIHDETDVAQCWPGAAINDGKKSYKIEKIISLSLTADTLIEENYSNLGKLVETSLGWVKNEFEILCTELTTELEAVPYQELIGRASVAHRKPEIDGVGANRERP